MHLRISEEIRSMCLSRPGLEDPLLTIIVDQWPAFYLGSVAPDFQTINDIPREETHFSRMPPETRDQSLNVMRARYPQLWPGKSIRPGQAAFVAAYLVHLQLDLIWHFDVVVPYFAQAPIGSDIRNAYLIHQILLAYLDHSALELLPQNSAETLAMAAPDRWLPFASDQQLIDWRDFLVTQLLPGAMTQTIRIFAERLRMTPDEFAAKLHDPDWMNDELFSRVPVSKIENQLQEAIPQSLELVEWFWLDREI